jgi:hypothetical protein
MAESASKPGIIEFQGWEMVLKGTKETAPAKGTQTLAARLARMKAAYELGVIWALNDALNLFLQVGGVTPDWVLDGAIKVIQDRLQNGKPIAKGGPGGNETSKKKYDMKHFYRWKVVKQLLKTGISQTAAFSEAVPHLAAKNDTVSWETVRDSYKRVEADWLDPIKRQKYYLPMFDWEPDPEAIESDT